MALEIRELTIRAVVNEIQEPEAKDSENPCTDQPGDGKGLDEKRILDLAMDQMVKLIKNKDER